MFLKNYCTEFIILHDVHNITIYNFVSLNPQFLFSFQDITLFVGIYK